MALDGLDAWTINAIEKKKLEAIKMWCCQKILVIFSQCYRATNEKNVKNLEKKSMLVNFKNQKG